MQSLIQRVLGVLGAVERVAMGLVMAMLFAVMVIVAADVLMRYAFNRPFSWAYDLISLYLMAGIFFLALSQTYAAGAHVNVDILPQVMPPWLNRICECVITATALVVFALITRFGFDRAVTAYMSADVMAGAIAWPTWLAIALMPLGAGLLCLRLAVYFVGHLGSLLTGRDLIPLSAGAHQAEETFE